jgi:hypothetical protein
VNEPQRTLPRIIDERQVRIHRRGVRRPQGREQQEWPSIVKMCRWLGVGRSSFNEWRIRPLSATAMRRDELRLIIAKSFDDSDGTYGYRRVHADLAAWASTAGSSSCANSCETRASCRVSRGRGGTA